MTLLTEQEARERWCPLVRCAGDHGNRDADGDRWAGRCIASDCMAWRFAKDAVEAILAGQRPMPTANPERRGYCGAFGEPQ